MPMTPGPGAHRFRWTDLGQAFWSGLVRARTLLLCIVLSGAAAAFVHYGWSLVVKRQDNATVSALVAGQDIRLDAQRPSAAVVAARLHYLLVRDRVDEAQALADAAAPRLAPTDRARLLYGLANARLRQALREVERREIDKAIPLVTLAKDGYRAALRLDPTDWDTKHNLDVAMRIVRDFPQIERGDDEPPQTGPKRVWTDMPGVPRGLP